MEPYANRGGDSGIVAYELAAQSIVVQFEDGWKYLYTHSSAGRTNIDRMEDLARRGEGLNEFINRTVRDGYQRKFR